MDPAAWPLSVLSRRDPVDTTLWTRTRGVNEVSLSLVIVEEYVAVVAGYAERAAQ